MKQCIRCKISKNENEFSLQIQRNGKKRLSSWCKKCNSIKSSLINKKRRQENPELIKKRDRERWEAKRLIELPKRRKAAKEKKIQYIIYMGGKCKLCGYDKCIAALDFHHIDPKRKEFHITEDRKPWENAKEELDKCVLLCSNCHKELHYNNWIELDAV